MADLLGCDNLERCFTVNSLSLSLSQCVAGPPHASEEEIAREQAINSSQFTTPKVSASSVEADLEVQ